VTITPLGASVSVTAPTRAVAPRILGEIRLVTGRSRHLRIAVLVALVVVLPLTITSSVWLSVLALAGISAIVVIGLNVLTGYAGQISLGQAVFVGVGSYTAAYLGDRHGLPMPVWLLGTAAVGAVVGAVVGPIALRVRGPYLIFVSLALLAIGQWVFSDWTSFTNGSTGEPAFLKTSIGPVNFAALKIGSRVYSAAGLCLLIWLIVLICLWLASNVDRSRVGRAMRAVRGNEAAASAAGISLGRTKISAFAVSAAMAAVAGALLAAQTQYVSPGSFDLSTSLTYLVVLMLGGSGTRLGPIIGALAVGALQQGLTDVGPSLPFIAANGSQGSFTVAQLTQAVLGLVLVGVLAFQPRGLAALWTVVGRLRRRAQPGPLRSPAESENAGARP
jgi:branched-chain amino acid transport system permease protein